MSDHWHWLLSSRLPERTNYKSFINVGQNEVLHQQVKLRKFGTVDRRLGSGGPTTQCAARNFRHFRWCKLGRISSNSLTSVLCLNVCRLCMPNIISLGIYLKKLHLVKLGALAWYSVKIGVIFGIRFEKRKVDKNANLYMKTETCRLYSRVFWICLPNVVTIVPYSFDFRAIPFQNWCVLRHSV